MTLGTLRARLNAGEHPREFAKPFGWGGSSSAYHVGPFIVKQEGWKGRKTDYTPTELRERKVRFAPTVKVKAPTGTWLIQLYYKPVLRKKQHWEQWKRIGSDIHGYNVGHDRRGGFVAFDW